MSNATSAEPARVVLDWRHAKVSDAPQPCVVCHRPALCRSPARDVPCHKSCAEAWISAHARSRAHRNWLIARYTPKGAR